MKKLFTWQLSLLLSIFGSTSFAQDFVINKNQPADNEVKLVDDREGATKVKLVFNAFELINVETSNGIQSKVIAPETSAINKKGYPDVPKFAQSIIINETNGVDLVIENSTFVEYENINLAPAKGVIYRNQDPSAVPYEYAEVYKQDAFFPSELASLNKPYVVRDKRGVSVWMYPVQYNPVTKVLRIYTEIELSVVRNNKKGINELHNPVIEKSQVFENAYANHFINYRQPRYDVVSEEGSLLIIAYDDFASEMDDYVAWKKKLGMDVTLVNFSEVGTTDDDIADYVSNVYNTDGLTFLLLVGDAEQVPATVKGGQDSDAAYGHIVGNDSYTEVIVGRFSGENTADIATQVERTINYERDLTAEDTWLSNGIGIASAEGGGGQGDDGESDIDHMDNIRQDLLDYGFSSVEQIYDPGATAADLATAINNGSGVINYVGHGSDYSFVTTGFSNSHVNALTNTGKLPFIFSVACVNGNFVNQTCFAEAWVRATHNNEPAGAVAIFASTINQSWAPPMDGQDEMNDLLTHTVDGNTKVTFGGIAINGCMHMNDEYGAGGDEMTDTWTIFGDPTLIVRNATPQAITPEHAAALPIGTPELPITVDADGAKVCLLKDSELIASGIVSEGSVTLDISSVLLPGEAELVIIGQQIETYVGDFMFIVPSGPYVISEGFSISGDDNNDGYADYNETFNIDVALKNVGIESAENVTVTLTSSDEYVESIIANSDISLGNIEVDETVSSENSFTVKLLNNVPDQHAIALSLVADANNYDETWSYELVVTANAPQIEMQSFEYNDDFDGNFVDGIIDPGETGEIICTLANIGSSSIAQLSATCLEEQATGLINITAATVSDVVIDDEGMAQVVFSIEAGETIYPGTLLPFKVAISAGAYEFESPFDVQIGITPEVLIGEQDIITSCFGVFYDSGKESNYNDDEELITTIIPMLAGNKIEMVFEEFGVENNYDFLYIYDGEDESADQVPGSPFSGSNAPDTIKATTESGALTFKFTSDGSVYDTGWKATFECVSDYPTCVSVTAPEDNEDLECNFTKLEWFISPDAVKYYVYFGETIGTEPSYETTENSVKITDLEEFTAYKFMVVPENALGNTSLACDTSTFTTGTKAVLMHSGDVVVNECFFFDDGAMDAYGKSMQDTLTLMPEVEGKAVEVNFMEFDLEAGMDQLYIYNGTEVSEETLIGVYDASDASAIGENGVVTATNKDGALTFLFESNATISAAGWKATIELVELVYVGVNNSLAESLVVYPNPVSSMLTIKADQDIKITLTDVSGKVLYKNEGYTNYQVDMNSFMNGLYFIQFANKEGVEYIQKIVKQ